MNGPGIDAVISALRCELDKGHQDCLEKALGLLVTGDEHSAMQVTVAMAVRARRGVGPRPGEDFHRLEVFTRNEVTGQMSRRNVDDMEAAERLFLQLGVAGADRDHAKIRDLWIGFVAGDPARAVELVATGLAMYVTSGTMWVNPGDIGEAS